MTCAPWPIVWPKDKPAGCTETHQAAAQTAAQAVLWARTGRRLGLCTIVETYDLRTGTCYLPDTYGGMVITRPMVGVRNIGAIFLEQQPVQVVHMVKVDGVELATDAWRLEGTMLTRADGVGFTRGEVEVTYTWGVPIGADLWGLVSIAMGEVAHELLQGMCGGVCKLPGRATSVTRQGVTVTLGGLPEDENLLGLPVADQLIRTLNPTGKRMRSRVFSPDMPVASRRRSVLPPAENVHGVSTLTLPDPYEGDPFSFDVVFPDAALLAGGVGVVDAELKLATGGATVATFAASIVGAVLTLTLAAAPAAGDYVLDVSVAGITYIQRTALHVNAQVSI